MTFAEIFSTSHSHLFYTTKEYRNTLLATALKAPFLSSGFTHQLTVKHLFHTGVCVKKMMIVIKVLLHYGQVKVLPLCILAHNLRFHVIWLQ